MPLLIRNTGAVPARVIGPDRTAAAGAGVLVYEAMDRYSLTLEELFRMGCDFSLLFFFWGTRPDARNFAFGNLSSEGLEAVHQALANEVMRELFAKVDWFECGFSVGDILTMQPSPECLAVFNVTVQKLLEHRAHTYGYNWQAKLNWSDREWALLKWDKDAVDAYIRAEGRAGTAAAGGIQEHRFQWGPASRAPQVHRVHPAA